ncbi:MAG TPA: hypothetical protein ENI49_02950 [Thermoplasmatales archaeon]|nr:hypothetical protein [Thermoplasmatales archaeon]
MREISEQILEKKKLRSRAIAKALFIISTLYLILLIAVILIVYYFGIGYKWIQALQISLPIALLMGIIIYAIFIIVILLLYASYRSAKKKVVESKDLVSREKPLYVYTYPEGARGGIFSRTIIKIDNNAEVNIRYQMVKPEELWL